MSERNDRGYRDEVGAAVERLEALAEENARLRAELDRLEEPKRRAARRRSAGVCVLMLGIVFGMGLGTFSHVRRAHHPHRHSLSHQRIHRSVDLRTRAPELETIRNANDCSIPYYYDRNNIRRYKASCLVDRLE